MFTRWQPWTDGQTELGRLHHEMNRLFDRWGNGTRMLGRSVYPPLNLWEDENCLYVEAELPGFELPDLEIHVTGDNQLSLRGERKPPQLSGGTWHRQERGYGQFSRMMELPHPVDSDKVTAEFTHGVLTVTLAKREEVKPRRIPVKSN